MTRFPSPTLRDWRRDGYVDHIGTKQSNGRWLYSHADAVMMATAQTLKQSGLERRIVLQVAETLKDAIIRQCGFKVAGEASDGNYAVFWLSDFWEDEPVFEHLFTDNPRRMVENESTFVFMIDVELVAVHRLPTALIESLSYNVKSDHNAAFKSLFGGGE